MEEHQWMRLVYLLALLVVIGPGILAFRWNTTSILRNIAIWLAIGVGAALAYKIFNPS